MNKIFKYSKLLHWFTFLCLLLPFFYTGCKEEKETIQQTEIDSTISNIETIDSSVDSSKLSNEPKETIDKTDNSRKDDKEEMPSQIISREYPFLRLILVSKKDTFSGLAMLIDTGKYVTAFSIFLYVLLSILGLIVKYIDRNAIKPIVIIETLSLLCLIISRPISYNCEILWGFWIAVVLVSISTIFDIYVFTKVLENKSKGFA